MGILPGGQPELYFDHLKTSQVKDAWVTQPNVVVRIGQEDR
jgi:hypothetical protein